jgi:hypothetical protein
MFYREGFGFFIEPSDEKADVSESLKKAILSTRECREKIEARHPKPNSGWREQMLIPSHREYMVIIPPETDSLSFDYIKKFAIVKNVSLVHFKNEMNKVTFKNDKGKREFYLVMTKKGGIVYFVPRFTDELLVALEGLTTVKPAVEPVKKKRKYTRKNKDMPKEEILLPAV